MKLPEKVAYLKGLMDGMKIDETSDNGKLFSCISEILEDVALQIEDLQDQVDEVVEAVDDIDADLADMSEVMFGDEFDDDEEDDIDLDLDLSDDDFFPPAPGYDGIGEEMFDEEDIDDEDTDLGDLEAFADDEDDDDSDSIEELIIPELDTDDDDDDIESIDLPGGGSEDLSEEEDIELETEELYEVICPTCKDKIHLTEAMLKTGSIDCPGCGEHLEFDLSDE
jgi:DNA-directed RNA polymerase subunit RPC12/RpoP